LQFAWLDAQLQGCCASKGLLRSAAGAQAEAAEDLLCVVSQAPRLESLATFQSVRIDVKAGDLTLSIEEVDMYARPLSSDGVPCTLMDRASLLDHSVTQALLIRDLRVRGQSILRCTS